MPSPKLRPRQALVCADANMADHSQSSKALETARVTSNPSVEASKREQSAQLPFAIPESNRANLYGERVTCLADCQ